MAVKKPTDAGGLAAREALRDAVMAAVSAQIGMARRLGFVVTVETEPRMPPSMGRYGLRIEVREAPEMYRS